MMEYPIFDVPLLGGSLLIAGVAIVHVFISHFSVGATVFMAVTERQAIRRDDAGTLAFLRKYSFLVLLVPYVLGTVTGVAIWFVTALVNPRAISILIHQFVWDWAIEWVLFIIEGVTIYLYVFRWDKLAPKIHNRIGWILAVSSVLTLVIINAILSFMLTPGGWEPFKAGVFNYIAIFNPSYVPTTLARFLISLAFAGVGAVVLACFSRKNDPQARKTIVSLAYKFMIPSILCLPLGIWTFTQLSQRAQTFLMGSSGVMAMFAAFGLASFLILFLAALVSLLRKDYTPSSLGSLLLVLLAFVSFGSMEFVREGVRKPYIIEGFMYSTGVTTPKYKELEKQRRANLETTTRDGVLSAAPWALPPGVGEAELDKAGRGQAVFKAACLRCHSVDGYNAIRPLIAGRSDQLLRTVLDDPEAHAAMPPFPGTEKEKRALIEYLRRLNAGQSE